MCELANCVLAIVRVSGRFVRQAASASRFAYIDGDRRGHLGIDKNSFGCSGFHMDKDSRTRAYVRQLSPNTNYQPAVPYPFAYIYIYTCSIDRKVITGAVL